MNNKYYYKILGVDKGASQDEVKKAFDNTIVQENGFRGSAFTRDEIVSDILDVALKYSQWMVKGADNSFKEINSINRGLERISNHLVGGVDSAALKVIFGKIALQHYHKAARSVRW